MYATITPSCEGKLNNFSTSGLWAQLYGRHLNKVMWYLAIIKPQSQYICSIKNRSFSNANIFSINIQCTFLNIYIFTSCLGLRVFLNFNIFFFYQTCSQTVTKTSKEDDRTHIWEKGQTQLLLMLLLFDSQGKPAFYFFFYLARFQLISSSQKGLGQKSMRD